MNDTRAADIKVVFFDVGGTILTAHPSVGEIYSDAVRAHGFEVDAETVSRNFRAAWKSSLKRRAAAEWVCDDDFLREDWRRIVVESFLDLVPPEVASIVFDGLYDRFCRADAWRLADGAVETFEALAAAGMKIGLLSNWDSRLEDTLESVGILHHFDYRIISWRVGVEKPHPRIFHEALSAAGVDANEAVHVGDSLEWDIAPACQLGIRAVWIPTGPLSAAPADEERDRGVHRIRAIPEILELVGLARDGQGRT